MPSFIWNWAWLKDLGGRVFVINLKSSILHIGQKVKVEGVVIVNRLLWVGGGIWRRVWWLKWRFFARAIHVPVLSSCRSDRCDQHSVKFNLLDFRLYPRLYEILEASSSKCLQKLWLFTMKCLEFAPNKIYKQLNWFLVKTGAYSWKKKRLDILTGCSTLLTSQLCNIMLILTFAPRAIYVRLSKLNIAGSNSYWLEDCHVLHQQQSTKSTR